MIVRIIKDWNNPDIFRQTPGGSRQWGDLKFTTEPIENADLIVVLNRPPTNILGKVRRGGLWLFSQESPIPAYTWHKKSFGAFDKVFTFWQDVQLPRTEIIHDQTSLPWHVGKSYDDLKKLTPGTAKTATVSWVTSNASSKEGHRLRLGFLGYLQEQKFPFSLFGRGFTPIDDKFEAIYPHKYSIAVENHSCEDYWTEKIADCFLSWSLPFYYGCSNILKYFSQESFIPINPAKPEESLQIIRDAIANNEWEKRLDAIREARELVLEKYQFFPAIAEKVKRYGLGRRKRFVAIPGNKKGDLLPLPFSVKLKAAISAI